MLTVDPPDMVRRQVVPLGLGAKEAIAVLFGMVVLLATNAVPPVVAGLLAAGVLVLLKVVTIEQAYRAISWTTVILVAGMIPLSTAMRTTGAAEKLASTLVDIVGDSGPYPLLIGLFVLTAVLGQLISNMATALIVIPIALGGGRARRRCRPGADVPQRRHLGGAADPGRHACQSDGDGTGGYEFNDYWKLGLPVLVWYFVIAVFWVPVIWRL